MFIRALCAAITLACLTQSALADHAAIGFGDGGAGSINTPSASTLKKSALALSLNSEYTNTEPFSDAELIGMAGAHVHAHSVDWMLVTSVNLSYGISDDLTFSLRVPYVYRNNVRAGSHVHGGGGLVLNTAEYHGNAGGLGDVSAMGKYRFWNADGNQAALLFGVKAPTGRSDLDHGGSRLETEHQPGSGSWDGLLGLALSHRAGPWAFDASTLYVAATQGAERTDLGNRLQYNVGVAYRIGGESHDHGSYTHQHTAWDLVLELNGLWSDEKKIAGVIDRESDGNEVFLSPGLRYVANEHWSGHVSFGVPVVSNIGEGHADTDFKMTLGITRAF